MFSDPPRSKPGQDHAPESIFIVTSREAARDSYQAR